MLHGPSVQSRAPALLYTGQARIPRFIKFDTSDDAIERLGSPSRFFRSFIRADLETPLKTSSPQDERILALVEPVADAMGLEVVRIRVMGGKKTTVQIMAERKSDGTMVVEDCARLSRAISAVFEEEDPVSGEYNLEVSSPGIDRPLTALPHFERWEGFEAKLELDRLVEGRKRFRGILAGIEDENVAINLKGEEDTALIPFEWIIDAKLVMTDELVDASLKARGEQNGETND